MKNKCLGFFKEGCASEKPRRSLSPSLAPASKPRPQEVTSNVRPLLSRHSLRFYGAAAMSRAWPQMGLERAKGGHITDNIFAKV